LEVSIDRFEGDWAVLVCGSTTFTFPRDLLPSGAREGDVLRFILEVDAEATKRLRSRILKLEEDLFR
jgi:hypothetical protein